MSTKSFQAETKRLMDLMIHSIYTNHEIFLREIISNASDAIDKLAYVSLTDGSAGISRSDFAIDISFDKKNRILSIADNGIGMDEQDLEQSLGVIAKSGTLEFGTNAKGQENAEDIASLIGQFGVGFYSVFMVADHVSVLTKKHGETQAYRWESDGADGYTITPAEKESTGTTVSLHIRPDGEEKDKYSCYMREYPIYKLVKKYSDFIRWPIRMYMPHPVLQPGSTKENPVFSEEFSFEIINSMQPIWKRSRAEVKKEELDAFYHEYFQSKQDPLKTIQASVEGNVNFQALLFIPATASVKYDTEAFEAGPALYANSVKITDHCASLLPEYFNFVQGVVDSSDLSLNISREMLQQDGRLRVIRNTLEKKISAALHTLLKDERETYETFFRSFGRQLKVCAMDDYAQNKEKLSDLLLFHSSATGKMTTLGEYVARMKEGQESIYYAHGAGIDSVRNLPQVELIRGLGYEILFFTDRADELLAQMFHDYADKPFKSVLNGDLSKEQEKAHPGRELTPDEERMLLFCKQTLGSRVDEVRISHSLNGHAVSLTSGDGITFDMERYFRSLDANAPARAKRILLLNPENQSIRRFSVSIVQQPQQAKKYAEILFQQACLIAGLGIENPTAYSDLVCSLFV